MIIFHVSRARSEDICKYSRCDILTVITSLIYMPPPRPECRLCPRPATTTKLIFMNEDPTFAPLPAPSGQARDRDPPSAASQPIIGCPRVCVSDVARHYRARVTSPGAGHRPHSAALTSGDQHGFKWSHQHSSNNSNRCNSNTSITSNRTRCSNRTSSSDKQETTSTQDMGGDWRLALAAIFWHG